MRRWGRVFVAVIVAVSALALAPSPASAHEDACAGWGGFWEGQTLGEPGLSPAVTTSFATNIVVGTCASGGSFSAVGTISGWCSHAVGTGVTNTGHTFSFVLEGYTLALTGQVTGVGHLQWLGRSLAGCVTGSNLFTAYWAVTLAHV